MFEIFVQNRSQNDSLFQLFSGDSSDFVLVSVAQVDFFIKSKKNSTQYGKRNV